MNVVERLVDERRGSWGLPSSGGAPRAVVVTPAYDTSRHVVALVFWDGALHAVVKVSRRPGDDQGLRREADILRRLERDLGVGDHVPRLLALEQLAGSTALVETALAGRPVSPERVRAGRGEVLRAGTAFVESLPVTGAHTTGWYDELVAAPVERLLSHFPGLGSGDLAARTEDALQVLHGVELPAVFEHGDLSHPNLMMVAPGRLGAVDWERSCERGLPGHDLVYLIAYVAEAQTGAARMRERLAAFEDALLLPDGWGRPLLRAHLERRGVPVELLDALVLACVVRAACTLDDRLLGEGEEELEEREAAAAAAARDRDVVLWRYALQHAEGAH